MLFIRRHLISLGLAVLAMVGLALLSDVCVDLSTSSCSSAQHSEENTPDPDHGIPGSDCCESHVHTALALTTPERHAFHRFAVVPLRVTNDLCPDGLSRDIDYPPQLS